MTIEVNIRFEDEEDYKIFCELCLSCHTEGMIKESWTLHTSFKTSTFDGINKEILNIINEEQQERILEYQEKKHLGRKGKYPPMKAPSSISWVSLDKLNDE